MSDKPFDQDENSQESEILNKSNESQQGGKPSVESVEETAFENDKSPDSTPEYTCSDDFKDISQPSQEEEQTPDTTPGGEVAVSRRASVAQTFFFWLQALCIVLIAVILIFTFIGRIVTVDGPSMNPTLENGDVMILRSIAYTPKQGDVVVLSKDFGIYTDRAIVKRVIAVEGQTLQIDYENDIVYVDGVALDEPYILDKDMNPPSWGSAISEITVPKGCVFVMGDNRNNSTDSRYPDLAAIDTQYILGQVLCVVFPFSDFGAVH